MLARIVPRLVAKGLLRASCGLPLVAVILLAGHAPLFAEQTVGLFLNDEASFNGYTLFAPIPSHVTYLINNEGKLVHSWDTGAVPRLSVYLLENGDLLRTAFYAPDGVTRFAAAGAGGRLQQYSWDGSLVWDYFYSSDQYRPHHDIERLPNGNVLMIAWEYKSFAEAIAAGRSPALLTDLELWPEHIIEVEPTGTRGGDIVWEWHVWDHLIQDYDPSKANYGVVADHPELIDLNYKATVGPNMGGADWTHTNSIAYNESLDQIILSVHGLSEIWVIDHSTTTAEAAGHTGGNSGMGGDMLYRWGNPEAYDRGSAADRKLFLQHDARWIEPTHPGAGNILVFNNGRNRSGGNYSSADEIVPPVDENGDYWLDAGAAFGPSEALWSYPTDLSASFYAQNISGAHRLPNGNTLICDGPHGIFLEVTPDQDIVWKYVSPINDAGTTWQGQLPWQNTVFRIHRYGPDYPAFQGRDLTPGDPLEFFTRPLPAPDGEAATDPMTCSRVTTEGDWIEVDWDAASCPAHDYHLIFGNLSNVSTLALTGSECAIGITGTYDWHNVSADDLFFLIVGVDDTGVYESSWGAAREGTAPSSMCGVTTKDSTLTCP